VLPSTVVRVWVVVNNVWCGGGGGLCNRFLCCENLSLVCDVNCLLSYECVCFCCVRILVYFRVK
jgi:hypothetical protein